MPRKKIRETIPLTIVSKYFAKHLTISWKKVHLGFVYNAFDAHLYSICNYFEIFFYIHVHQGIRYIILQRSPLSLSLSGDFTWLWY